ncbi:UNVERIFIED_CONTAM: hypothetical protein Sradi_2982500 [Sesamum radiatum]|uniref:Uncharacterized protein n=1 Tax=Sesamum radiatum TaxID=300843 RepID=A0AAW2S198_SESRA
MTNSDNEGDHRSFEGNTSLPSAVGSTIPPPQVEGDNFTSNPVIDLATVHAVLSLLLAKQLRQFTMEIVQGSS